MKKITFFLVMLCLSVMVIAQPIKTQPVRFFFEGYSPEKDCPTCPETIKKPVVKLTTKPAPNVVKPVVLPPLPAYRVETDKDGVINITISNNNNNTNINGNQLPGSEASLEAAAVVAPIVQVKPTLAYVPDLWLRKGTAMILSGIGCQLAGLGVWAFSTIDRYEMTSVTTSQSFSYQYYTYSLVETSVTGTVEEKCWPTYTYKYKTYQLKEVQKTGVNTVNFTDTSLQIKHQNKNAYYITAGVLGATGLILEICGIVNNHNSRYHFTGNGVAVTF